MPLFFGHGLTMGVVVTAILVWTMLGLGTSALAFLLAHKKRRIPALVTAVVGAVFNGWATFSTSNGGNWAWGGIPLVISLLALTVAWFAKPRVTEEPSSDS